LTVFEIVEKCANCLWDCFFNFFWQLITCQFHETSASADKIRQIRWRSDSRETGVISYFYKL